MKISERVSRMGELTVEAFGRAEIRIKRLEARIAELEAHSAKTLAMGETTATPGSTAEWKMIAKGGAE